MTYDEVHNICDVMIQNTEETIIDMMGADSDVLAVAKDYLSDDEQKRISLYYHQEMLEIFTNRANQIRAFLDSAELGD